MYVCQDGQSGSDPDLVGILNVLDLASGETTEVMTVHLPDEPLYPRWSRDGQMAVVQLNQWDTDPEEDVWLGSQVATVPVDGGDFERLTPADMWAGDPDWSPIADTIVFGTYGIHDEGHEQAVDDLHDAAGWERPDRHRRERNRWTDAPHRPALDAGWSAAADLDRGRRGHEVNDVKLAFLDMDGTVSRIPFGSEDLSGVGARLQPLPAP